MLAAAVGTAMAIWEQPVRFRVHVTYQNQCHLRPLQQRPAIFVTVLQISQEIIY